MNPTTHPSASVAVVFPGQVFDAGVIASALAPYEDDPLLDDLAEVVGTRHWADLDLTDASLAGPCTLVAGLLSARRRVDRSDVAVTGGHSFGEITAIAFAGGLSDHDALTLVRERGRASRAAAERRPGAMAAVIGLPDFECELVRRRVVGRTNGRLDVASDNDRTQAVFTGDIEVFDELEAQVVAAGGMVAPLPIPGAYHSPSMESAVDDLRTVVESVDFLPLEFPVVSGIDGAIHEDPAEFARLLPLGLLMPVLWQRVNETLVTLGHTTVVDAGPGDTLTKIGRRNRRLRFVDSTRTVSA